MGKRVFITAAEVSGDLHSAQLIESLKKLSPDLVIEGIGGPAMAKAGATLHRETVGNAAMTWKGAFRALEVWKILQWTKKHFREHRPDLQICVDSFAMNIHFAKNAHRMGVPVLMYVAPQLWAWRESRMKKLRANVDCVACLLPFEEEYFQRHGVKAMFVGHPLFDELPADRQSQSPPARPANEPVVGLLPGSRKSEAQANFLHMLDVADLILEKYPKATFLVPTTRATNPIVASNIAQWKAAGTNRPIEFALDAFDEMVPKCTACLTVSGTATLHTASFNVPMVVVYRVNPLAWHLAGRWMMHTRTFALVNLLAGGKPPDGKEARDQHIVPEFVPWLGSNRPVADAVLNLLNDPEQRRAQQQKLADLIRTLDRPGASDNVAKIAMEMMGVERKL